jgi:hypothetical protein
MTENDLQADHPAARLAAQVMTTARDKATVDTIQRELRASLDGADESCPVCGGPVYDCGSGCGL